jgi:hypothetical protein
MMTRQQEAYKKYQSQAFLSLKRISEALDVDLEPDWADVSEMEYNAQQLKELEDRLYGTGEYAN